MSDIVNKKYKISVHTINNSFLYAVEFYKNFILLRDKIKAGADLVRTITSNISNRCLLWLYKLFTKHYMKTGTRLPKKGL